MTPESKGSEPLIFIHNILINNVYLAKNTIEVGSVHFKESERIHPGEHFTSEWHPDPRCGPSLAEGQSARMGVMKDVFSRNWLQKIFCRKMHVQRPLILERRHSQISKLVARGESAIEADCDKDGGVKGVVDIQFPPELGDAIDNWDQDPYIVDKKFPLPNGFVWKIHAIFDIEYSASAIYMWENSLKGDSDGTCEERGKQGKRSSGGGGEGGKGKSKGNGGPRGGGGGGASAAAAQAKYQYHELQYISNILWDASKPNVIAASSLKITFKSRPHAVVAGFSQAVNTVFKTRYRAELLPISSKTGPPPLNFHATLYAYMSPEDKSLEPLILIHNILINNVFLVKHILEMGSVHFKETERILPGEHFTSEWHPDFSRCDWSLTAGQSTRLGVMKDVVYRNWLQKIFSRKRHVQRPLVLERCSQISKLVVRGESAIKADRDESGGDKGVVNVEYPPMKVELGDTREKLKRENDTGRNVDSKSYAKTHKHTTEKEKRYSINKPKY
ncbi:hypothetical protein BDP27DRAFT_1400037 [Rhodocollybia butyracea]|uniref:Uncharacterized protein n=1 Tax=Rhodocollybia butyracea TaxID=206335 RepID=A0A9P5Q4A0_9AGAR|nr:hypothetical protein BDP27DRAFT_1400037 [Rhodocollybia butyracea]